MSDQDLILALRKELQKVVTIFVTMMLPSQA